MASPSASEPYDVPSAMVTWMKRSIAAHSPRLTITSACVRGSGWKQVFFLAAVCGLFYLWRFPAVGYSDTMCRSASTEHVSDVKRKVDWQHLHTQTKDNFFSAISLIIFLLYLINLIWFRGSSPNHFGTSVIIRLSNQTWLIHFLCCDLFKGEEWSLLCAPTTEFIFFAF
jgi:hypothetical protein